MTTGIQNVISSADEDLLQKQLFKGNVMTVLQILEKSQESNREGVLF